MDARVILDFPGSASLFVSLANTGIVCPGLLGTLVNHNGVCSRTLVGIHAVHEIVLLRDDHEPSLSGVCEFWPEVLTNSVVADESC